MIKIYYPRECPVNLGTVIAAKLQVHIPGVPGLSISEYKDLMIDMQKAINIIEAFPSDFESYCKNKEEIEEIVDIFNRQMYLKWWC